MFAALALSLLVVASCSRTVTSIKCYTSEYSPNSQRNLTTVPFVAECKPGVSWCMKSLLLTVHNRVDVGQVNSTVYFWGCGHPENVDSQLTTKCGNLFEETHSIGNNNGDFAYSRRCSCCGDLCNTVNVTLLDDCSQPPLFTKQCYGATSQSTGDRPNQLIPCTENMSCVKEVGTNGTQVRYGWTCQTLPEQQRCGSGYVGQSPDGNVSFKVCSCCGDKCLIDFDADSTRCGNASLLLTSSRQDTGAANRVAATTAVIFAYYLVMTLFFV